MNKEIFIATRNKGKIAEFKAFFQQKGLTVKSLLDLPEEIDVVEDGNTFEDNAMKKAETIGKRIGKAVLADDSGLEVDALNGKPGIFSARYAGEAKSDEANNKKLLTELSGVPDKDRTARFVCALAIYFPTGKVKTVRGTCDGIISQTLEGDHGFGYDPLFYLPQLDKMMAELTKEEKNKLSHRANALVKLADYWEEWSKENI
ncbi:non-canonical purine NTP pyrophosphatase [Salipaludibacillus keqinensis]|uniref:dITP/XTP pyrophosphatase n=1 Tax=Salipaludibacillus keqinensis TaxID=2045207 RepID=A0A323TM14_9BACI|nr:XTP/dITP diphosphatase [Salipaludibacillus keqinensis]PYZ93673.1 non-canonical purine NTP pyrophosphatase [Salipaludibacillus keqinensis]